MYSPGHLRERSRQVVLARKWGLWAIFTIPAGVWIKYQLERLEGTLLQPRTIAYFALVGMTVLLLFLWVWATDRELDLLFRWLDPKDWSVPSDLSVTAMILGFAVVLGALFMSAWNVEVYGAIFTLYSVCILFSVRRLNRQLSAAFKASHARLDEDASDPALAERTAAYRRGVDILQEYFLARPHTGRHLAVLLASFAALLLAAWAKASGMTGLTVAAYAGFVVIIGWSEGQITRWRHVRDLGLAEPDAKLHELDRAPANKRTRSRR